MQGIPIKYLLSDAAPNRATEPARPEAHQHKPKKEEVSGRALAICQLLRDFYRAVPAEDVDALDRCLVKTPGSLTAREVLALIAEERDRERNFDALGPVTFDARTHLTITPKGSGRYEVECAGVIKSFRRGEKWLEQRQHNTFQVRRVDKKYKLLLTRKDLLP